MVTTVYSIAIIYPRLLASAEIFMSLSEHSQVGRNPNGGCHRPTLHAVAQHSGRARASITVSILLTSSRSITISWASIADTFKVSFALFDARLARTACGNPATSRGAGHMRALAIFGVCWTEMPGRALTLIAPNSIHTVGGPPAFMSHGVTGGQRALIRVLDLESHDEAGGDDIAVCNSLDCCSDIVHTHNFVQ